MVKFYCLKIKIQKIGKLLFLKEYRKWKIVIDNASKRYCKLDDFKILIIKQQKEWDNWIDEIPAFGCKISKYDLNW